MRDNLRRYRAIRAALSQGDPGDSHGQVARHCTTLAALISGIVGSKSTPLPNSEIGCKRVGEVELRDGAGP